MHALSPVRGILAMTAAMMLLPLVDALSKLLTGGYTPEQITWVRNLIHALVVLPLAVYLHGWRFYRSENYPAQLLRGLAFTLMTLTYIMALSWMPLADALAIVFLNPFLVTAVSPIFLGERVGWLRWLAVLAGFVGVVLVIMPDSGELNKGVPFAILAALFTAAYAILTRKLSARSPTLVMLFLPALVASIVLGLMMPWYWIMPSASDAGIMIAVGMLAAVVHALIVVAYRYTEASYVVPFSYFQIVVASLLGYYLFGDVPGSVTWLGITLIITSGLAIVFITSHHTRIASET